MNQDIEAAVHEVKTLRVIRTEEYPAAMSRLGCNMDEISQYLNDCKKEDKI